MKYIKLLSVITLSSLLVACSPMSQQTGGSGNSESQISQGKSQEATSMSFYDYITQSDEPVILYKISTDKFAFDSRPDKIYVFSEKGNYIYESPTGARNDLTLGDLSEMSDEDILEALDSKIAVSKEFNGAMSLAGIYLAKPAGFYGYSSFIKYYESKMDSDEEEDGFVGTITDEGLLDEYHEKYLNGDFVYKYEITDFDTGTRYMDDSGNTVLSRAYDYDETQIIDKTDFYTDAPDYLATLNSNSFSFRLKYPFEGVIYDSTYKGLKDRKSDYLYLFRTDVDITIDTD